MIDPIQFIIEAADHMGPTLAKVEHELDAVSAKFGVAENSAAQAAGQVSKMAEGLSALTTMGAGLAVAAVIGGIGAAANSAVEHVKELAEEARDLVNLQGKTGVKASELHNLSDIVNDMRLPTDALATSMRFLERSIAEQKPALIALGVTSRDPIEAFRQLADGIQNIEDPSLRTATAMDLLGRGGTALLPMLELGSSAIDENERALKRYGVALDDVALNRLANLDLAQADLHDRWEGMATQLSLLVLPYFEKFIELAGRAATAIADIGRAGQQVAPWLSLIGGVLGISSDRGLATTIAKLSPGAVISDHGPALYNYPKAPSELDRILSELYSHDAGGAGNGGRAARPRTYQLDGLVDFSKGADEVNKKIKAMDDAQKHYGITVSASTADIDKQNRIVQSLASRWTSSMMQIVGVTTESHNAIARLTVDLFNTIEQAIIQALADIAAKRTIGFLASFIPGLGPAASAAAATQVNIYANMLDSRSLTMDRMNPTGSARATEYRLAELGSVS